jgi:tetratricopeptide (TPR) repeat protein
MSHSASYEYQIEAQRRREIHLQRVAETTRAYLHGYHQTLDQLERDGLQQFIEADAQTVSQAVQAAEALLATDPELARERSQQLAWQIAGLPTAARAARQHAEELERHNARLRAEEAARQREASHGVWDEAVGAWPDPLTRELAYSELVQLRQRFFRHGQALASAAEVREAVEAVRALAQAKARLHRDQQAQAAVAQTERAAAEQALQVLRDSAGTSTAAQQLVQQAAQQSQTLAGQPLLQALAEAQVAVDAAAVEESCRREAVRAVVLSLRNSGFVVDAPYLQDGAGGGEVVVRASKPAGQRAEFRVTALGDLSWHFDRYSGAACKRDIAKVLPQLQDIYGIKLSSERVHWQNPDDQSASARPQPADQEKQHG